MTRIDRPPRLRRFLILALVAGLTVAAAANPAPAQTAKKFGNSLDFVPADAASYTAWLRNKEQLDIAAGSKAWKKFEEIPAVAQGLGAWQVLWAFQIQPNLGGADNKQLLDMVGDLLSSEVFYYEDVQAVDAWALVNQAYNGANFNNAIAQAQRAAGGAQPEEADQAKEQIRAILKELASRADKLDTPTFVMGFKFSDADRVKTQLARLEKAVNDNIDEVPQLKGRFSREKVGGDEFLTLKLDGGMIPWDQVPLKEIEKEPGEFDGLVSRIKQMKLAVALGIHGDYLLLSISKSPETLAALGKGAKLADKPELARLQKFQDKRVVSIGYQSPKIRESQQRASLDTIRQMSRAMMSIGEIPAEIKKRLKTDLDELAGDVHLPKFGIELSVCQLTERGYDSYSWDWSEQSQLDASKPLDIVEHLGGTPLIALVNRTKSDPADYRTMVKWLKRAYGYVEDFAVPQLKPDEQKQYKQWFEMAKPLLARLDNATEKMLIPSLADGQIGLIIDAKLTSRSWFKGMPRSETPLPMAEPALVFGVSDPELLRKAVAEYRAIADEAILKISQMAPGSIPPDFKIPDPQVRETPAGAVYSYAFPKNTGIDYQLAFSAGLGKKVAVVTIAPKHTAELLATKAFDAEGPAADAKKPRASLGYLDWAGLVEAATPWVEYGVRQGMKSNDEDAPPNEQGSNNQQLRETLAQVRSVMDLLKVLRTVSSSTYVEDGVLVSHTETHFKDIE